MENLEIPDIFMLIFLKKTKPKTTSYNISEVTRIPLYGPLQEMTERIGKLIKSGKKATWLVYMTHEGISQATGYSPRRHSGREAGS